MSILIRSMDIPTSCDKCRFCVNGFTDDAPIYECAVQSEDIVSVLVESDGKPFDFRPDWCPLIELPPHGRLIDADEKKTKIIQKKAKTSFFKILPSECFDIIRIISSLKLNIVYHFLLLFFKYTFS